MEIDQMPYNAIALVLSIATRKLDISQSTGYQNLMGVVNIRKKSRFSPFRSITDSPALKTLDNPDACLKAAK